jgi:hypothetical protein
MVCVDLLGSFTTRKLAKAQPLLAITKIDPVTGWFDIVEAINKSATSIQVLFHNTWLAAYLRTQFIFLDDESIGEFKCEFKQMCYNHGIKTKPTKIHYQHTTSNFNH